MRFSRLPKDLQLQLSLRMAEEQAQLGKASSFRQWWFFDTNCLSELVKMQCAGEVSKISEFIEGRDILLASTTIQEIRKRPDILRSLESSLQRANVYVLPDMTRFWYTDVFNFLNVDGIPSNSLQVYPLIPGFLSELLHRPEFEQACLVAEHNVAQLFLSKIEPDIGANLDERDLCVCIWSVINTLGREWFKIDIPPADCHAENFPAFYTFYYTYYFRYIKNRAIPELNDFIDLANTMAVPYCARYYCEEKFANVLRLCLQGREPPSPWRLIKKTYRKGLIDSQVYTDAKSKRSRLDRTTPLLRDVCVYDFSEMKSQIVGIAA